MSFVSFLLEKGVISNDIHQIIVDLGHISNSNMAAFLVSATNLSENDFVALQAEYYGFELVSDVVLFESRIAECNIDYQLIYDSMAFPYLLSQEDQTIFVAICDPENIVAIDNVKKAILKVNQFQCFKIILRLTKKNTLLSLIRKKNKNESKSQLAPIEIILASGIEFLASDIHITPYENTCEIKYRIDGEMMNTKVIPINKFHSICGSIKVLAKLNISETRRPQSGHFQKNNVDFRVSTHPTIHGENICIRILNRSIVHIDINNIGFNPRQVKYLKKISQFLYGMIIFCGPTGSGKTTSIYSMLETIDKCTKNIMTLEDPIEYKIYGIKQTEIKEGVVDFSDGIKSILRQDPDVLFIGEIRDQETARVAIRAAMTGHLVFTTIHANDSIGAIKRFQDFNISFSLIADNIIAVIAQRLVKAKVSGRTIISEILHVDSTINEMIYKNASKQIILDYMKQNKNFKTLEDDCREKIILGKINADEIDNALRLVENQ
jgi:type II secretory ATPase GspE/PulE/Tfp pilus assembly ATPase PilB-like protein